MRLLHDTKFQGTQCIFQEKKVPSHGIFYITFDKLQYHGPYFAKKKKKKKNSVSENRKRLAG